MKNRSSCVVCRIILKLQVKYKTEISCIHNLNNSNESHYSSVTVEKDELMTINLFFASSSQTYDMLFCPTAKTRSIQLFIMHGCIFLSAVAAVLLWVLLFCLFTC